MVEIDELHRQAVARAERMYRDPQTSLWVMTRLAHLDRGSCCGSGCRHCPWAGTADEHPDRPRTIAKTASKTRA